jgi:hypothetical protein
VLRWEPSVGAIRNTRKLLSLVQLMHLTFG